MKLHLQFVTPEKTLFNDSLLSLTCQTQTGQITILPSHVPLVANLVAGEMFIKQTDNQERVFHVGGGVLRVKSGNEIIILADAAEHVVEIDEARSREAIARAKVKLAAAQLSDREYANVSAKLERDLARIRIVRKHSHRHRAPITSEGVLEG